MVSGLLPGESAGNRWAMSLASRKRLLDVLLGSLLALVAVPVIAILALGVAVSLRAWPFFAHTRPGWRGREVWIVKLRTLPPSTPRYADKGSLGISEMPLPWLCRGLRRTHLDELPQLFAVVRGHMSLVGPRPRQPIEADELPRAVDAARSSIRPGCTGLWQVSTAADGNLNAALKFDLFYLERASVLLDVWIICRTVGWIIGLARPIDLPDVPRRLCGSGLAERAAEPAAVKRATAYRPTGSAPTWLLEQRDADLVGLLSAATLEELEPAAQVFPRDPLDLDDEVAVDETSRVTP
jgi:lipopolysaccharide/colanic/teichoic acid biosynthesis glycosyltransferase